MQDFAVVATHPAGRPHRGNGSSAADPSARPSVVAPRATATLTVVIPALNEAKNLRWTLERIPDGIDEVVLVDGRSTDDTVAVAMAVRPEIVVVTEPRRGKGRALRSGFEVAAGDFIVMLDADGSMNPAEIPRFVELLDRGYDFVKGSRYVSGGGSDDLTWLRRVGNAGLLTVANLLFYAPFTDLCYGFCAFRRDCLPALALAADGFEIETELVLHAVKAGLRVVEIPSVELARMHGASNLRTFRDGQRVLRTLLRERLVPRPGTALPTTAPVVDLRDGHLPGTRPLGGIALPAAEA